MNWVDFIALKRLVPITEVCRLIGWEPLRKEDAGWRGKCPLHSSGSTFSRSFAVSPEKNVFHCLNKKCGQKGDQIRLYSLARGLTMIAAARAICKELGIICPEIPQGTKERNGSEGRSHV